MLVFTILGPIDASDFEVSSLIMISKGEDGKGSEVSVGCKVAGALYV